MGSEHAVPEDLRELYDRSHARTVISSDWVVALIERIAALEAQVEHLEGLLADLSSEAGVQAFVDSFESLKAQVAALSKPVSDEEYYRVCTEGARTTRGLWNINRIIASRLKPAPDSPTCPTCGSNRRDIRARLANCYTQKPCHDTWHSADAEQI